MFMATFTGNGRVCTCVTSAVRLLGMTAALFLISLPLFSQGNQGTIQGGVFDQSGGAVAGAMVSVADVARGVTRALTTDDAGQYVASSLTPGTYTVRAEAKGFRTVEHSGVLVEVGQNIRVDLVVQPGEQTQTITVTGEIPAVDTTDATLGGTVSNESINSLPLNGRNFERLLQLRPGSRYFAGSRHRQPEHQWHAYGGRPHYDRGAFPDVSEHRERVYSMPPTVPETRRRSCRSTPSRNSILSRIPRRNMAGRPAR